MWRKVGKGSVALLGHFRLKRIETKKSEDKFEKNVNNGKIVRC